MSDTPAATKPRQENTCSWSSRTAPSPSSCARKWRRNHVARIKELARKGFYDGVVFHRVIEGFMAQGGDPTGTGTGGSDMPDLPAEFSNEPLPARRLRHGAQPDPNSANSQFFICFAMRASSTASTPSGAG